MPRSILWFLTLGLFCAAGAFGQQGTFAQIAYGGSWQTTFTLLNLSTTDLGSVTLSFFADDGSPLNAPIQSFGNATSYTFTIPEGGTQNVVLANPGSSVTQGWATMNVTDGIVRGQGSFRFLTQAGQISEAVVPLNTPGAVLCIFPIPPSPNPVIQLPFDNTAGQYVTSVAIANTTSGSLPVAIEFVDSSNVPLASDTLNLSAMQHTAFVSRVSYPAVDGKKGTLRIHASPSSVTVLGLLSNATNAITTIMPVTQ
jgi:hypothetical protein